jgi:superfamily II DNA or RNA helicase
MEFIRDSCIRIPIAEGKGTYWFEAIVRDLRRYEKRHMAKDDEPQLRKDYYDKDLNRMDLMIPRYYPLKNVPFAVRNEMTTGKDIDIQPKSKPRNARQIESIDYLSTSYNGILCLSPGEGKTVVSILSVCNIGKKTIVFVHKDNLAEQWFDRFQEHSHVGDNQMIRLSTNKFQKQIMEYDIIVSTVQTFCRCIDRYKNFYELIRRANIGVAIWDECHTSVSAEQFSKSSLHIPCRRTFGLSATPKRLDGNTDIMNYHLGPVYQPFAEGIDTMTPKVVLIKFDHGVMKKSKNWIFRDTQYDRNNNGANHRPRFDPTRYLKKLCTSDEYIKKIRFITNQISKSDRKMLFIADRIKILDHAAKGCVNSEEVGFFIPRSGKKLKFEHLKRKMVFSTYGSSRDGTDKKELDCLVLATTTSNLEQATGRVIRSSKGKQQPIIMDFVDTGDEYFINKAKNRILYYQQKGWPIEEKELK